MVVCMAHHVPIHCPSGIMVVPPYPAFSTASHNCVYTSSFIVPLTNHCLVHFVHGLFIHASSFVPLAPSFPIPLLTFQPASSCLQWGMGGALVGGALALSSLFLAYHCCPSPSVPLLSLLSLQVSHSPSCCPTL